MILIMPWPDKGLSPNARIHRMAKARLVKKAWGDAYWLALNSLPKGKDWSERCHLAITFHPPDKRRRDLDNMLASCKAMLDGIAAVMRVDDYNFTLTLKRGDPIEGGAVEIEIGETQ